jgi:hypothetical protein
VNIFELKIWDDESRLCTFYTVHIDETEENETDKFFLKYENSAKYGAAAQELLQFVLLAIGEEQGAVDALFNREENEVEGLPCHGKVKKDGKEYHYPGFPLRLYALRITENIVVLFNGGVKDADTNQKSSLHTNWKEACAFAKRIREAFNKEIAIETKNRCLIGLNGETEIIL